MKIRTWCTRLVGVAALGGTVYILALTATPTPTFAQRTAAASTEIDRTALMSTLLRVGISPEALAVSGIGADQVPAIFSRASEHMRDAEWALSAADELCKSRDSEVLRLEEVCGTGQDQEGDHEALEQARLRAAEAATSRATVLDGIFHAAIDGLPDQASQILNVVRHNQGSMIEPELMVVERTAEDWQAIREAMASSHGAQRRPAPREVQDLLSRIRADAEVVAARERLGSLEQMRQAWREAVEAR
jgi:hypothetical protein